MSKLPWRHPINGEPSRTPPIIRLVGYDGPPELGQQIVDKLAGRIRQYYLKQAQNYGNGAGGYSKTRVRYPDLAMSYAVVGGQEIVTVEISPEALEPLKPKQPIDVMDYALIDLHIPNSAGNEITLWAFCEEPPGSWGGDTVIQNSEFIYGFGYGFVGEDFLTFAPSSEAERTIALSEDYAATLKVDMSRMPVNVTFRIDIYGFSRPVYEYVDTDWVQAYWAQLYQSGYNAPVAVDTQSIGPRDICGRSIIPLGNESDIISGVVDSTGSPYAPSFDLSTPVNDPAPTGFPIVGTGGQGVFPDTWPETISTGLGTMYIDPARAVVAGEDRRVTEQALGSFSVPIGACGIANVLRIRTWTDVGTKYVETLPWRYMGYGYYDGEQQERQPDQIDFSAAFYAPGTQFEVLHDSMYSVDGGGGAKDFWVVKDRDWEDKPYVGSAPFPKSALPTAEPEGNSTLSPKIGTLSISRGPLRAVACTWHPVDG